MNELEKDLAAADEQITYLLDVLKTAETLSALITGGHIIVPRLYQNELRDFRRAIDNYHGDIE